MTFRLSAFLLVYCLARLHPASVNQKELTREESGNVIVRCPARDRPSVEKALLDADRDVQADSVKNRLAGGAC